MKVLKEIDKLAMKEFAFFEGLLLCASIVGIAGVLSYFFNFDNKPLGILLIIGGLLLQGRRIYLLRSYKKND